MKYDFTSILDRKGKDSIAADAESMYGLEIEGKIRDGFSRIPMWVADMNFKVAPSIHRAITDRMEHQVFGYFAPSDEYYRAISEWHEHRKGATGISRDVIGYDNSVLGGLISAMRVLCGQGGSVLLHSPAYIGFTMCLQNNGFNIVHSPLKRDESGVWRMDFDDMDRQIKKHHIHAAIFCSPHNPCGRVWEREEIEAAMEVYRRNDVFVIADEIWSDLTLGDSRHIPVQSISEDAGNRTVALYAPSKTFNIAGIVGSYSIIYNQYLRDRIHRQSTLSHYNEMNVLSMHALIGAYSKEGAEWVDELRQVLERNVQFACACIRDNFRGVEAAVPQGTYMLFLDCEKWCAENGRTIDELLAAGIEVGVIWQDGRLFGGTHTIRMNLASPESMIREAFARLDTYVFNR